METRTYWTSNGKRAYDIEATSHKDALRQAFGIDPAQLTKQGPALWDYVSQTDDGLHFQYWVIKH